MASSMISSELLLIAQSAFFDEPMQHCFDRRGRPFDLAGQRGDYFLRGNRLGPPDGVHDEPFGIRDLRFDRQGGEPSICLQA